MSEEEIKKEYKEITKLNLTEKILIITLAILTIANITLFIVEDDIVYFLLFIAWLNQTVSEYFSLKTKKVQDSIIEIQQETIETQHKTICKLLEPKERKD